MAYIIFFVKADRFSKMLQIQRVELEIIRIDTSIKRLQAQIEGTINRIEGLKG